MLDFLDVAHDVYATKEAEQDRSHFDLVRKALAELDSIHAKASLSVANFESVLGAFDAAEVIGRLGTLPPGDIAKLGSAIRRVIVKTLESRIVYPIANGTVLAPPPFEDFLTLIQMLQESGFGPVSFITLNYDLALDYDSSLSNREL